MVRHLVLVPIVMALGATAVACSDDDASGGGGSGGAGQNGGNVKFAEVCAPPPDCGGDPMGSWTLVDGCAQPPAGGFHCTDGLRTARGTIEGTLTLSTGEFNMNTDSELHQCGWIDGSGDSASGPATITGNVLSLGSVRDVTFCVDGNSLWFYDQAAQYSDLTVMHFTRATP